MFHPGMMMGGMPPPMMGPGMGMMGGFGGFNPRSMPGWFGRDLLGGSMESTVYQLHKALDYPDDDYRS